MKSISEEIIRFEKIKNNAVEVFLRYLEKYKYIENIPKRDFIKLSKLFEYLDTENERCLEELEIYKNQFH